MTLVVVIAAVILIAGVVAWFLLNRQHPERTAGHAPPSTGTTSEQLYGGADRPAGPDAETMDPDQLGGDQRPPSG